MRLTRGRQLPGIFCNLEWSRLHLGTQQDPPSTRLPDTASCLVLASVLHWRHYSRHHFIDEKTRITIPRALPRIPRQGGGGAVALRWLPGLETLGPQEPHRGWGSWGGGARVTSEEAPAGGCPRRPAASGPRRCEESRPGTPRSIGFGGPDKSEPFEFFGEKALDKAFIVLFII